MLLQRLYTRDRDRRRCVVFVWCSGYAGRTELPDNLKSLFRPVAMMVPDLGLIAEVMLQAEGFVNSRILAKKTVTLYGLMVQQLSKQDHYDYGLRSLRGVLMAAGALKRASPDLNEEYIMLQAIRDMNMPKFIKVGCVLCVCVFVVCVCCWPTFCGSWSAPC